MDIAITLCVVGGVLCAVLASSKRRSVLGWFVIGMLFPVIGVILILVLPSPGLDMSYRGTWPASDAQHAHLQTTTLDDSNS